MATGKAVLFIGAGISNIAGCRCLRDTRQEIILQMVNDKKLENEAAASGIANREIMAYAKSAPGANHHKYDGILRRSLTPDKRRFLNEYCPFIEKLKQITPFPPVMTTNFDDCLTKTELFDMAKIYHKPGDMRIKLFQGGGVFHLHGYMEDAEGQLWDMFDYEKRYNEAFKTFLAEVFRTYSVLFLGYAFGEDYELRTQMAIAKKESQQPKPHFVLFAEDDPPESLSKEVHKELLNIEVIQYGPKDKFVGSLSEWIDSSFPRPLSPPTGEGDRMPGDG